MNKNEPYDNDCMIVNLVRYCKQKKNIDLRAERSLNVARKTTKETKELISLEQSRRHEAN